MHHKHHRRTSHREARPEKGIKCPTQSMCFRSPQVQFSQIPNGLLQQLQWGPEHFPFQNENFRSLTFLSPELRPYLETQLSVNSWIHQPNQKKVDSCLFDVCLDSLSRDEKWQLNICDDINLTKGLCGLQRLLCASLPQGDLLESGEQTAPQIPKANGAACASREQQAEHSSLVQCEERIHVQGRTSCHPDLRTKFTPLRCTITRNYFHLQKSPGAAPCDRACCV